MDILLFIVPEMNIHISEDIINKVFEQRATQEEIEMVVSWFKTDAGQKYLSQRIDKDISNEDELTEYSLKHNVPADEIYKKIKNQIFRKRILNISKYAALIVLPILILGWGLLKMNSYVDLLGNTEYVDVYVPKGKQMQVVFQDGSMVYLNSDSKLRYPKKFRLSDRKVELNGEAYFIIEKNPDRPFVVEIENVLVNVYGTSFNVDAFSSEREVSLVLDEGIVNFETKARNEKYALNPGEKLVYNKLDGTCTISENNRLINESLWKDDIIYIDNESLENVLKILDRKYDVRFKIEDSEVLRYKYTIMIAKNSSLNKVLVDLERIAPVRFERQEKYISVKINKK